MGRIREFGSLYLDGVSVRGGAPYVGDLEIGIGNTAASKPLQWIQAGYQFIAGNCILTNISWLELSNQKYAPKRTVTIDGVDFVCRLPSVGTFADELSEWKMLARIAQIEHCPYAQDFWFWGADELAVPGVRPIGHLRDSGKWAVLGEALIKNDIGQACGWRPVLEPIGIPVTDDLVGKRITAWSGNHALSGKLIEVSDYDLVLDNVRSWPLIEDPRDRFFRRLDGKRFAVDREAVSVTHLWVQGMLDS